MTSIRERINKRMNEIEEQQSHVKKVTITFSGTADELFELMGDKQ
jgi:hypothetical protein